MKNNVSKALQLMRKEIEKDWSKLDFEYEVDGDTATAKASGVTLNNINSDIFVEIKAYSGGGTIFRAVLDKLDLTGEVYRLMNEFNDDNAFFKVFVGEKGYLTLEHYFVCYEMGMYKEYAGEFLYRLAKIADNEIIQTLARQTHD